MKRVMIVGQPGSGKSTFARAMGEITKLPVYHIDHIHRQSGWVERPEAEKDRLRREVHARQEWIFEGGRPATWAERLERADTLIWLDLPLGLRITRVLVRTGLNLGRTRPALPDGCPERFSLAFLGYIWRTRNTARARLEALYDAAPPEKSKHRLASPGAVAGYLRDLACAVRQGNLGRPHR